MLIGTTRGGHVAYPDADGRQVIVLNMRPKSFKPRRTHAAERTTSTRRGAGSRRNRRTGYAARAEQYRAFGRKIRVDLMAGFMFYLERDLVTGESGIASFEEQARLRGLLDTLPDGTLELRGTFI